MSSVRIRRLAAIISGAMLAMLLVAPAGVIAATPDVVVTGTGPTPSVVSPGETVAFTASLTNRGSSTISQLSLTTVDEGLTVALATSDQGSCASTSPLSCSFRNVKPGDTVLAFVVLNAKTQDFGVQFKWDTTGVSGDQGGNSHGDSFYYPYDSLPTTAGTPIHVGVNGDTINFRSRYVLTSTQKTVENSQVVGSDNPHATKVVVPVTLIPVTVSDVTSSICAAELACFGDTSVVEVAGGTSFLGGFQVIITMDSSEILRGVNAKNVRIYHIWDGGSETINTRCSFSDGLPTSMPCLTATKVNGKDLQVIIWTTHNGGFRGGL